MSIRPRFHAALPLTAALLVLSAAGPAMAQDGKGGGARPSADALRQRLEKLRGQLESERAQLDRLRAEHETELKRKRQRRRTLAGTLVSREAERQRLRQQAGELKDKRRELAQRVGSLEEAHGRMIEAARTAADKIAVHLQRIPGRTDERAAARAISRKLGDDADASPEKEAQQLEALAQLADKVHRGASRLSLRRAEIRTAGGRKQTVELLAAGHIAFAYRRTDNGQVALALASPAEASGFRWETKLPSRVERRLRKLFDRLAKGAPAAGELAHVPMDVTGRLRSEAVQREEGGVVSVARSGGPLMIPLAAVAAMALLLAAERGGRLYLLNGGGRRVAEAVIAASRAGRHDQAEQLCRKKRGAEARVLAACLSRRHDGQHSMEDAIQEQLMHETPRLQRGLGGIAVLAATAPLLGLLGTVTGIIETFGVIRAMGQTGPSLMAGGISEALVTTATGLGIAIPILLIHAVLRGRAARITADAEKHAATLLNVLTHGGGGASSEAGAHR